MDKISGFIKRMTSAPEKPVADTGSSSAQEKKSEGAVSSSQGRGRPPHRPSSRSGTGNSGNAGNARKKKPVTKSGGNNRGGRPHSGNGRKPSGNKPAEVNTERLKYERKTPTTPSRPVKRVSHAQMPNGRKQRPRPMLGRVNRETATRKFPMYEKLPAGTPMRIIPLGGLNEVGKNSMAIEFDGDIILIDIGLQFPEENMPGVDYVIPDLSYVVERKSQLKGVLITHGHLDHIGAIHHYIEKLGFPTLYATRLTKALIEKRLDEHNLKEKVKIVLIDPTKPESRFALGKFTVEYFRVNHSIPDSTGLYIKTEAGSMVHTGDFKFDLTPVDGMQCDYQKMTKIAAEGVDMVFADSTNAVKDGFCPSEKEISENIRKVFLESQGKRVIMATFASSIGRLQSILNHAVNSGRKVFIGGRSMNENIRTCHELGIIDVPRSAIRKLDASVNDYRPEEVLILTTGSQGEPFAALSRISRDEHPHIQISEDDVIAFSSSPIPGNERSLYTVIDAIYRKGASVLTKANIDIHASGHAFRGDLKLMHSIMQTKYVVPIHGEYFMRIAHRQLATDEMDYDQRNVIMLENGGIVELRGGVARRAKESLEQELVFVDGKDHADLKEKQINERLAMAEGGLITVLVELDKESKKLKKEPRIFTEGFLENPDVHGVIIDHIKTTYGKLYSKYSEKITEKAIVEGVGEEVKLEMLREVAREPVVQVIVTLG